MSSVTGGSSDASVSGTGVGAISMSGGGVSSSSSLAGKGVGSGVGGGSPSPESSAGVGVGESSSCPAAGAVRLLASTSVAARTANRHRNRIARESQPSRRQAHDAARVVGFPRVQLPHTAWKRVCVIRRRRRLNETLTRCSLVCLCVHIIYPRRIFFRDLLPRFFWIRREILKNQIMFLIFSDLFGIILEEPDFKLSSRLLHWSKWSKSRSF